MGGILFRLLHNNMYLGTSFLESTSLLAKVDGVIDIEALFTS